MKYNFKHFLLSESYQEDIDFRRKAVEIYNTIYNFCINNYFRYIPKKYQNKNKNEYALYTKIIKDRVENIAKNNNAYEEHVVLLNKELYIDSSFFGISENDTGVGPLYIGFSRALYTSGADAAAYKRGEYSILIIGVSSDMFDDIQKTDNVSFETQIALISLLFSSEEFWKSFLSLERNIFIHEYIHLMDFVRFKDYEKYKKGKIARSNAVNDSDEIARLQDYLRNDTETNARYHEMLALFEERFEFDIEINEFVSERKFHSFINYFGYTEDYLINNKQEVIKEILDVLLTKKRYDEDAVGSFQKNITDKQYKSLTKRLYAYVTNVFYPALLNSFDKYRK